MPQFFASNALMPYDKMPEWLRLLAMVNPLSHTIDSILELFIGGVPVGGMIGTVQFRRSSV
jgi:ABC-2 type transport system permease protein